jgi:hypothetical protein
MRMLICVTIAPRRVPKSERPPSRPLSPYFVFFLEHYKKRKGDVNTAMDARDVAKESSVIWKNLTIAEKQVIYIVMIVTCRAKIGPRSLTTTRPRS